MVWTSAITILLILVKMRELDKSDVYQNLHSTTLNMKVNMKHWPCRCLWLYSEKFTLIIVAIAIRKWVPLCSS